MRLFFSSIFRFYTICMAVVALVLSSCAGTNMLNCSYLDDGDMTLSMRKLEKSEMSFQLYREGSAGATGGKSGGGCGCN